MKKLCICCLLMLLLPLGASAVESLDFSAMGISVAPSEALLQGIEDRSLILSATGLEEEGALLRASVGCYYDGSLARAGVYAKSLLEEAPVEEYSLLPSNTLLGETEDYAFYFSAEAEMPDDFPLKAEHIAWEQPTPFDENFEGFAQPLTALLPNIGEFRAPLLDGGEATREIFANHALTMLNAWTTWCGPCLEEMPHLAEIAAERADTSFQIVGLICDAADSSGAPLEDAIETARLICEATGAGYPMLVPDAALSEGLLTEVLGFPQTYFVDSAGNLLGQYYLGAYSKEDWSAIIDAMLRIVAP